MSGCIQFVCKCDKVVLGIASCLCGAKNNVLNLGRHIQSLKSALDEIKARREGLWRNVQLEEMKGMKCRPEVRLWLSNYKKIVPCVNDLLNQEEAENQKLFFSGYCSKGYCSSWKYSADVRSMLVDVEKLHSKGVFTTVAESHVITKVKGIAIDQTISERKMVESTWSILMEDRVGTLGLYGIPGVGKTTLLSQINNEFLTKENDFYVVIWVLVPKDQNIQSMQEQIGRRLDIYDEEWIEKTENEKAFDIKRSLSKIRFALLLDDMLVKVNLRMLGVPPPDLKNKCKVAFTTRRKDVCRYMGAEEVKEVTRLDDNAAWVLFQEHVGEDMLRRNQGITAVAKIICEKCCGLPIVINAIGQTMAPKTTVGE